LGRLYTSRGGFFPPLALVAQRIEQKTSNLLAAGSIPAEGTPVMCRVIVDM
jgi:hypothetical protein